MAGSATRTPRHPVPLSAGGVQLRPYGPSDLADLVAAFGDPDISRWNPARTCRVATAAGFALEGVARQSYRYPDGLFHDEHLHARLASDPAGTVSGA